MQTNPKILFVRETHPEIIYPLLYEYAGNFFCLGKHVLDRNSAAQAPSFSYGDKPLFCYNL